MMLYNLEKFLKNWLRLQIVQKECERDFSVARTTDVKLVDDVL